jgi:tRNA(fMet)-specific endonuclease VapC
MLDTDTCIFLMRGESPTLAVKVQSVPLQQQVMSAVTFAELSYGVQASATAKRKQNQAVLDSFALHLAVVNGWDIKLSMDQLATLPVKVIMVCVVE